MFRVLLVDDEPSIRLTMGEFLKRAGYSVLIAQDYDSAAVHKAEDLDVAVVDINLPGKSGIQLLQKLCDDDYNYVPVIMITGEPNLSVIPEIVRAGAYYFIAKPIIKDVLLKAVARAAEKKRLTDEKRLLEQEIKRYAEELEMRVDERTAELVETHKRLVTQERIAALGRAAAQVAHEVKNPLAGLLLYSLHLKSKATNFSESETYLVDKIVETINHLISRVEQILSFARPVSLSVRPGNVSQFVNDILELLRPQLTANKVDVRLSLGQEPAYAMVDESSMRGALMNLILNAIEAMPEGGTLNIAVDQTDDPLRLEITDTGRGIAEEEAKKIFEPFYTTKAQGLGLGMPYAKKIIDQHRGAVCLNSRLGEGTTISITLPAAPQEVKNAS
jgi:signal transduction histidine kinase